MFLARDKNGILISALGDEVRNKLIIAQLVEHVFA